MTTAHRWLSDLVALLREDGQGAIPAALYLLGGGARLEVLSQVLSARPWHHELTCAERLEVRRLEAEELAQRLFRNARPVLRGPEETVLACLASRLSHDHSGPSTLPVAPDRGGSERIGSFR